MSEFSQRAYAGVNGQLCNTNNARVSASKTAQTSYYKLNANEAQIKDYLYSVGPLYATMCRSLFF